MKIEPFGIQYIVPIDRFHYLCHPEDMGKVETKNHQIKTARPYMCFAYLIN
jgi:hypothetical protein